MNSFFKVSGTLSSHQFGFRSNTSTSDAIIEFLDGAYNALHDKKYLLSVMLDFSKAFDTVNHGILLRKMKHLL